MPIMVDDIDEPEMWALLKWMAERSGGRLDGRHVRHRVRTPLAPEPRCRQPLRCPSCRPRSDPTPRRRTTPTRLRVRHSPTGNRPPPDTRGDLILDVLSTDHFPADPLVSLSPRLETFQTPGGSQAVKRRESVEVSFRGDAFMLPRPNLLGAVVVKAAASLHANRPKDHRDLAHLTVASSRSRSCHARPSASLTRHPCT